MRRIVLLVVVTTMVALMLVATAMPAFAQPGKAQGKSKSQCNAGGGNGTEPRGSTVDCDPGNSGFTPPANR